MDVDDHSRNKGHTLIFKSTMVIELYSLLFIDNIVNSLLITKNKKHTNTDKSNIKHIHHRLEIHLINNHRSHLIFIQYCTGLVVARGFKTYFVMNSMRITPSRSNPFYWLEPKPVLWLRDWKMELIMSSRRYRLVNSIQTCILCS